MQLNLKLTMKIFLKFGALNNLWRESQCVFKMFRTK